MSNIPLPALLAQTPAQSDPVSSIGRILALKSLLGQQKMQDIETQQAEQGQRDQQATTQALRDWDGQNPNDLPHLILKNGGSSNAVLNAQSKLIDMRQKAATLDETTLKSEQTRNDQNRGRIQSIIDADPGQQNALWDAEITKEEQAGNLKPGQVSHQYPGDDQATYWANHFALGSTLAKEAIDNKSAQAKASEAQTSATRLQAELPGGPLNRVTQDVAVATNPQIQAGKVAVATAEGQARANMEAQTARGSNAALANVPPHLIAPATEAATKAGTEYAQAQSVTQRLQAMMDAAKNGNVVSYQLIPQEGALQLTTSQGVHRINMAEIQNYGGGSLWDRLVGHIGKQLTGKSIPDNVLNDMAEMQKIQAEGARSKYENTLQTINQNYGSNFRSVQMQGLGQTQSAPPRGATMKVPGSDGRLHWSDGKNDLGVVQ